MSISRSLARLGYVLAAIVAISAYTLPAYGSRPQQSTSLVLPIYKMSAPTVDTNTVEGISTAFDLLSASTKGVNTESYKGFSRLTVPSQNLDAFLEQYAATGGFYAFKPALALSETGGGQLSQQIAIQRACSFLFRPNGDGFIGADGELLVGQGQPSITAVQNTVVTAPPPGDCTKPGYKATPIYSTIQDTSGGSPTSILIGMLVQVPLTIDVQGTSVPLGGAGGHLSLLFNNTDTRGASLYTGATGLGAVSMPFYGRETQPLVRNDKNVELPALDPATLRTQITQRVQAAFPGATSIAVPEPTLLYDISDASTPQSLVEPKYNFSGIEVIINGEKIVLRDIKVPAVDGGAGGLGPSVAITTPAANSTFQPGSSVSFSGSISDGVGPYKYSWQLEDGTEVMSGTLNTAGVVQMSTNKLAAVSHGGYPSPVTVSLIVTDAEGVQRSAFVSLNPTVAPSVFLPITVRNTTATSSSTSSTQATILTSGTGYYDFGIEANSDYQPYGSGGADLPGVPPDANGFRSSMQAYGWGRKFDWRNASAWEKDWRDCGLGGGDCSYGVDRTDFAYYSGHGGAGGISMTGNNSSTWADGSNARFSTLRWAAFSSCQTLRAQPNDSTAAIRRWFNSFQGAHMLLGFNSNMADIAFGGPFADRMRPITFFGIDLYQMTIREAWVLTAFNMNAGKPAYIYAIGTNGVNPVDNKLPKANAAALSRPFPAASYHWVWWNE